MQWSRRRHQDSTRPSMAAMIDVVFLLLVYFVMTFKIVAMEGQFLTRGPTEVFGPDASDSKLPLRVRLIADASGGLAGLQLNDRPLTSFAELHKRTSELVMSSDIDNEPWDVVLDCDYTLDYQNVIHAITAVTGSRAKSGETVRLPTRIRFAPLRY